MLIECDIVKSIWCEIHRLGSLHWIDYKPIDYNQIPDILKEYDPIKIYHISAIWALWVTWCKYFYDPKPVVDWKREILTKFKEQFYKRIAEVPSMIQWLRIIWNRRDHSNSGLEDTAKHVSEKEFLLIHTQSVKINSTHLVYGGDGLDPIIEKWIGKGYLVSIDYDALHGNKPRLKLNHNPWSGLIHMEDPSAIPPQGWTSSLPLSVIGV